MRLGTLLNYLKGYEWISIVNEDGTLKESGDPERFIYKYKARFVKSVEPDVWQAWGDNRVVHQSFGFVITLYDLDF